MLEAGRESCCVRVKNTGGFEAGQVVQVYVESPGQKERWNLCGFAPVALAPGQEKQVVLPLSKAAFCRYDDKGDLYTLPGRHTLHIGFSQPDERSVQLCGTAPVAVTLDIQ